MRFRHALKKGSRFLRRFRRQNKRFLASLGYNCELVLTVPKLGNLSPFELEVALACVDGDAA